MRRALFGGLAVAVITLASAGVTPVAAQTGKPATRAATARDTSDRADTVRQGHSKSLPVGAIIGSTVKGGALPPKKKKP